MKSNKNMFQEFLNQIMEEKSFGPEDLAKLTHVPLKHILALKEAKFEELPANVFVKGYLLKIAKVLNVDFEELWNLYLEDYNKLAMPKPDILPSNRFEQSKKVTHHLLKILRYIPILAVIITVIGFIFLQSKNLFGEPKLKVTTPAFETIETTDNPFVVEGEGQPHSYITINNKEIYLSDDGKFSEPIQLKEGLNEVIIEATNRAGKTKTITRKIYYQNPTPSPSVSPIVKIPLSSPLTHTPSPSPIFSPASTPFNSASPIVSPLD